MKHLLQTTNLCTALTSVGLLFFVLMPVSVFAEVVPLAPLPTQFGDNTDTLGGYINTIFYTIIAAAAVLAVLRIVWGGFQYMTSEAVTQTKDARTIITMAVVGLILLLGSWLILNVINPNLTKLEVLKFEDKLDTVRVPDQGGSSQEDLSSYTDLFSGEPNAQITNNVGRPNTDLWVQDVEDLSTIQRARVAREASKTGKRCEIVKSGENTQWGGNTVVSCKRR